MKFYNSQYRRATFLGIRHTAHYLLYYNVDQFDTDFKVSNSYGNIGSLFTLILYVNSGFRP